MIDTKNKIHHPNHSFKIWQHCAKAETEVCLHEKCIIFDPLTSVSRAEQVIGKVKQLSIILSVTIYANWILLVTSRQ